VNIKVEEQDAHRSRRVPELVHGSYAIAAAVTHSPGRSRQHHKTKQSTRHIYRYTDHLMVMRRAINRLVLFHTMRHRFTNQTGRGSHGCSPALQQSRSQGHTPGKHGTTAIVRCHCSPNICPAAKAHGPGALLREKVCLPPLAQYAS
jgi:hypothetical protein